MEDFQIVVRADSDIESIADLAEKRISLGEDGSGVAKNAEYILNSAGISMNMVNTCCMNYQQSAEALKDGEIDAFFAVLGAPADVISQLAEDISIRLLPMDERTAAYMTNLYEGYFSTEIKAGTYSGINEDVPTIGVKAVLVADASADAQTVKKLTAAIFENSGDIEKQGLAAPNSDFATSGLPCAFHKGAVEYYKSINISVNADDN
ncbi:predicted periplasmic binding protein [Ruminococcus sp. CAG:579]|nr:predicted periplasmic binding protein [Ruminococcus sp. CAG:579]